MTSLAPFFMPLPIYNKRPSFQAQAKPPQCGMCPLKTRTYGFLGDAISPQARIGVMFDSPGQESIMNACAGQGRMESGWVYHNIIRQGYDRADVFITHVLRCGQRDLGYPTARDRLLAENNCRTYDKDLLTWQPNLFLISFGMDAVMKQSTLTQVVRRHVQKAFQFADEGYRPLILVGDHAASLIFPYGFQVGNGGIKAWHGHWFPGEWPFRATGAAAIREPDTPQAEPKSQYSFLGALK